MALTAISHPLPVAEVSVRQMQATPSDRFYRPELDLLRFFAFLSVFLHHGLPGFEPSHHIGRLGPLFGLLAITKQVGSFGVCLFFLLSAYLITELLQRERASTGGIRVRSFYLRRILRIWPLYFSFLFVGVALGAAFPVFRIENGRLLAFLLLSGNWYAAVGGCGASPIAPLWSISVEEQFYLIWPWLSKAGSRAMLWRTSILLLPISWAAIFWLSHNGANASRESWVNSLVQFQFFALGSLLALALNGRAPNLRTNSRVMFVLVALLCWYLAQGVFHVKDDSGSGPAASLILGYCSIGVGCVLLFLGFLGMSRRLVPRQLIYLGKISYGLYVFHMVALDCMWKLGLYRTSTLGALGAVSAVTRLFLIQTTALALTIALAIASYKFLERPFLRIKQRFSFIESRAI